MLSMWVHVIFTCFCTYTYTHDALALNHLALDLRMPAAHHIRAAIVEQHEILLEITLQHNTVILRT